MRTILPALNLQVVFGLKYIAVAVFSFFLSAPVFSQCQPQFESTPQDITVDCGEEIPAFTPCEASSDCCEGPVSVTSFTSETGAIVHDCIISTAYGPGIDWAIWLPEIGAPSVAWNFVGDGHLQVYADGTGHLWGLVANAGDASLQWQVDLWFQNGKNWEDWSALGRSYKNDLGFAGTNYLDWMYYELVPGFGNLEGAGDLAGSHLELAHQPADFFYGFQMGIGANNKNGNDGFSGWFTYEGTYNGESVSGHGDVNVNESCQDGVEGCAATAFTQICRAEDSCGNLAFQSSHIFVTDEEAPVVDPFEDVITIDCEEAENIFITATDNCSDIIITYTDEIITPGCGGSLIRTYLVSDACGNSVLVSQTIFLLGEGVPEFTVFPEDTEVSCELVDAMPSPIVEWLPGCANTQLAVTSELIPGDCSGNYTLEHTYTLTDACGNVVSQVWTITVTDNVAPQLFDIPADINMSCGQEIPPALPFALDNCSEEVNISLEATTEQMPCGYLFIRTWTATDDCGNSTSASQIIHVSDAIDPLFTFIPPSVTVNCDEPFELDLALVIDQCSNVELTWTDVPLGDCAGSYMRIWRAFDGCGNQALESTVVTKIDETAPVMIAFPEDITVNCNEIPATDPDAVQYMDNCGAVVKIFEETIGQGDCETGYVITRTWTLTDDCGNSSEWNWHITVIDNLAPIIFGVPDNASINCGDEISEAVVVATDNCDEEVLVTLEATTEPAECGYLFIRTWTATDDCGNTSTASQIIEVNDQQDPVFTFVPDDTSISCGNGVSIEDLPLAEASDDCSGLIVTHEDIPQGENCDSGILRVFTATDGCGNSVTATQVISFSDNEAPVFTFVPESIEGPCGQQVDLDDAIATDNCSDPVITFEDVPGIGCAGSFTRTYTATDGCGNTTTAIVTVAFSDDEDPIFTSFPSDISVNCNEVPSVESVAVEYSDNCGAVDVEFNEEEIISDLCAGSYELVRTWTITDDCGNTASMSWNIVVTDQVAPMLIGVPEDATLNCGDEVGEAVVTAIDNCDADVNVSLSATTVQHECGFDFIRTWTAIDDCGNIAEASQTVSYSDDIAPVFTFVPPALNLGCDGSSTDPTEVATAEDDCSEVVITFEDEVGENGCAGGIVRHWIATDGCGNVAVADQQINVNDQEAPVITSFPQDVSVSCDEVPTPESAGVTFEDDCGNVITSYDESIIDGNCENSYILERTWTFTDACGNSVSDTWTIFVLDEESPVLLGIPADMIINCGDEIEEAVVTAIDNCTSPENIQISLNAFTEPGECGYTFIRVWTAIDECGNSSEMTQEILVSDNSAPVFSFIPSDITVNCGESYSLEDAIATDDCSDLIVEIETSAPDCAGGFTRTFTATDGCGNSVSATQNINIVDEEDPTTVFNPTDENVDCGSVPVYSVDDVIFIDNCSDVSVTFQSDVVNQECSGSYTMINTWIGEDACGNRTTVSNMVVVTDSEGPEFNGLPEDLFLECGDEVPAPAVVSATDECGTVSITSADEIETTVCGYIIHRTFTATDDCQNSSAYTQSINFEDTTAPEFTSLPEDLELECDQDVPVAEELVALDDCSGDAVVTMEEEITDGSCPANYTITRTYTATDDCGNSVTHVQTIEVSDSTDPDFLSFSSQIEVACTESNDIFLTAFDDCSVVNLTYTDEFFEDECAGGLTRTYTALDVCGNSATAIQVMNLIDNEVPQFVEETLPPLLTEITDCSEIPVEDSYSIGFIDDCSNTTISMSDVIEEGSCSGQYVIHRTWTILDGCSNSNTHSVDVSVSDETPPMLVGVPGNIEIDCSDPIPSDVVFAIDNCDLEPQVSLEASTEVIGCQSFFTRRWIATDACGNISQDIQVILITDLFAPELSDYPADISIVCGDPIPAPPVITAIDNCDSDIEVTMTEENVGTIECPVIVRTWCAVDCIGHSVCHTQTITSFVVDEFNGVGPQFQAWQSQSNTVNMNMRASEEGRWNVELFDITGRRIDNVYSGDMSINEQKQMFYDVSSLKDAVYLFRFTNGNITVTQNVAIVR